jgi:hypothetical protein
MANISVTYTFVNGATSDAPSVNQNFTDIINGTSDGTKAITVDSVTATSVSASSARFSSITGPTLTGVSFDASTNTLTNVANASISNTAAIAVSKIATGTAGYLLGANPGATSNEFKQVTAGSSGSDFTVTMTTGAFTINLPDAGSSSRGLVNASTVTQTFGGPKEFASSIMLQTSGGTQTKLDYYEQGSFTSVFDQNAGAGGSALTFTVKFSRIGNIVHLLFPDMSGMTAGATATNFRASGPIASRLRPSQQTDFPVGIQVAGTRQAGAGAISIRSNGDIVVFRDLVHTANFSASANNGSDPTAISYPTA